LKAGDYVVYESTTYPGCTEEDWPAHIGTAKRVKRREKDFKIGYSPERVNPGRPQAYHFFGDESGGPAVMRKRWKHIAALYELVVHAGIHRAPSIKVAEASKIMENTQREPSTLR